MANVSKNIPSRDKVRAYRTRMRGKGMRQITLWVPDTRTPLFAAEARRQSRAIAGSALEAEDLGFIASLYEDWA
jgi:hypothetical protein